MDGMAALQQSQSSETLGQAIIPAINKLQDIFSQVLLGNGERIDHATTATGQGWRRERLRPC